MHHIDNPLVRQVQSKAAAAITRAICSYFRLQSSLLTIGSSLGLQLDAVRLGQSAPSPGAACGTIDDRLVRLADASRLVLGLSPDELEVLRLRYWARCGLEHVEGRARSGALVGYSRAKWASYEDIGREMGLSARQVERRCEAARARVALNVSRMRECE